MRSAPGSSTNLACTAPQLSWNVPVRSDKRSRAIAAGDPSYRSGPGIHYGQRSRRVRRHRLIPVLETRPGRQKHRGMSLISIMREHNTGCFVPFCDDERCIVITTYAQDPLHVVGDREMPLFLARFCSRSLITLTGSAVGTRTVISWLIPCLSWRKRVKPRPWVTV